MRVTIRRMWMVWMVTVRAAVVNGLMYMIGGATGTVGDGDVADQLRQATCWWSPCFFWVCFLWCGWLDWLGYACVLWADGTDGRDAAANARLAALQCK